MNKNSSIYKPGLWEYIFRHKIALLFLLPIAGIVILSILYYGFSYYEIASARHSVRVASLLSAKPLTEDELKARRVLQDWKIENQILRVADMGVIRLNDGVSIYAKLQSHHSLFSHGGFTIIKVNHKVFEGDGPCGGYIPIIIPKKPIEELTEKELVETLIQNGFRKI